MAKRSLRLRYQLFLIRRQTAIHVYQMHGAQGVRSKFCRFFVLQLNAALNTLTTVNRLGGIRSITSLTLLRNPERLPLKKGVT